MNGIEVFGVLDDDAQFGIRRMNDAVVTVQLRVTSAGAVFEASVVLGDRPEDHKRAMALASSLRRATPACIVANDMQWCADHGRARFIARGVRLVQVDGETVS